MLKGHLPKVMYHQVYVYTKTKRSLHASNVYCSFRETPSCLPTLVFAAVYPPPHAVSQQDCPPRQKSRVAHLKAKTEHLLTQVTVETSGHRILLAWRETSIHTGPPCMHRRRGYMGYLAHKSPHTPPKTTTGPKTQAYCRVLGGVVLL